MTRPGDQTAAAEAGRGHLRTSRADREQVIDALKTAFVQDRLNRDEFDERVGQALTARTYAELAALTDDIPGGPAAALPREPSRDPARLPESKTAKAAVYATLVAGLVVIAAIGGGSNPLLVLGSVVLLSPVWLLVLVGLLLLHSRLDKRAARRVPRAPGPGCPGLDGQQQAGTGDDLALPSDQASPPGAELRAHQTRKDCRTVRYVVLSQCTVSKRRAALSRRPARSEPAAPLRAVRQFAPASGVRPSLVASLESSLPHDRHRQPDRVAAGQLRACHA
jgi:Domain of unknown function (DUF1707)